MKEKAVRKAIKQTIKKANDKNTGVASCPIWV